ncbi:hypothetical protein KDL29_15450 [bacterium]|nr:hypothetical protein [bacterium]
MSNEIMLHFVSRSKFALLRLPVFFLFVTPEDQSSLIVCQADSLSSAGVSPQNSQSTQRFLDGHKVRLCDPLTNFVDYVSFVVDQTSDRLAPGYRAELALDLRARLTAWPPK